MQCTTVSTIRNIGINTGKENNKTYLNSNDDDDNNKDDGCNNDYNNNNDDNDDGNTFFDAKTFFSIKGIAHRYYQYQY